MESLWNDADANAAVARYAKAGVNPDLALRTYSARLLGADPSLVLHGGGNTSVKTTARDLFGESLEVLCVKGSGWDLATIEPQGHPAVRLESLLRLRSLERLSDEEMVNVQRQALLDSQAPNPSVETLLHAFLPGKFIDHTHAVAVLALADQPDSEALIARLYGPDVVCVPYVPPGFELALRAAAAFEAKPQATGMVLINHGVFSWGATARESYERMITMVQIAEAEVARARPLAPIPDAVGPSPILAKALPIVRGLFAAAAPPGPAQGAWILDTRDTADIRRLTAKANLVDLASRGVATPDHVIRTKRTPLVLPHIEADLDAWRIRAEAVLSAYIFDYKSYFSRNVIRYSAGKTALDPMPRLIVSPDFGLIGVGRTVGEAAIAADIGESWAYTVLAAEDVGTFAPITEAATFDMEYWSLEQAKLGKSARKQLEGQVVVVTGGAGAIGQAVAKAFAAEGAAVALLDLEGRGAAEAAAAIGPQALPLACDVTDPAAVTAALAAVCARFGGIDIVVSNAGTAISGDMAMLADEDLRRSFEINLFAHQAVAKSAIAILKAQAMGGALLFNVSKQALNPGPGFGAYGASKAALLALVRQYALEHGRDRVRVNAVNPDRIRSGLLTTSMIAERAAARGVDAASYMSGNLLGEEVTAEDVAQAFVFAALMKRTTGAILTVDGGNVAAMVR
jgi:rhamnose utilization protein RhaD (predicted bifunctional aldolase and dehydrogenase)/NAD(P)-dependent dehydrogenase (short-subunit alcohol dehydrogenase family)